MIESHLSIKTRLLVGQLSDARVWPCPVGKAVHYKGGDSCPVCKQPTLNARIYTQHYGLCVGCSDLIGMIGPRFMAMELKTLRGRLTDKQRLFLELIEERDGFACVVRATPEDAMRAIEAARRGDSRYGF